MSRVREESLVWRRRRGLVLLVGACALVLLAGAASAEGELLSRCSASAKVRTLCGGVAVPLDRGGAQPGSIVLRVRALPPQKGGTPTGTILALAGGPGQAATPLLGDFASALAPALRSRRLVTFDQRGTGGSARASCPALSRAGEVAAAVGRCAAELGPARIAYTTAESIADVEAVRAALGVERLILYGTSYGTKVALGYAAAFPQHVERLVLDSAVLPEGVDPFDRTTLASIPRVLRTLCAYDCPFTRDPVADLAALVRRLARAPLRGSVLDGAGHARPASLTRAGLLTLLLAGDFDRQLRAQLPAAVRAALERDPAPLLRLAAAGAGGAQSSRDDSDAVYVATTCEDGGVPWAPGTPLQQRRAAVSAAAAAIPSAAFAPFDRATVRSLGTADLCRAWPESPIAQPQPVLPTTPALILSGDDDLRTPRADALALAARLPGAQLLRIPDAGHGALFSDLASCATTAVVAFLDGKVPGRCRRHPRAVATASLPPRDLDAVASIPGVPPATGRLVRAILDTYDDAVDQVVSSALAGMGDGATRSFGGLRAGSATVGKRGLRLRGYAYVAGVPLSGLIDPAARTFTLKVGGREAVRGRVTVSATGVAGTLGGKPVDVSAKQLRWAPARAAVAVRAIAARPASEPVLRLPADLAKPY